ncbi:hypothetical protein GCM10009827_114370 [Dactylosporangium maewongense]|uniref:Uncharacterized protein n=1 Tax=Dactylosporangium maewongense TaxID=634393 RepID=A0ABP4P4L0_9ACTN
MMFRRWAAQFDQHHLVLQRRRLLPWRKSDVRTFPLAAVVEMVSLPTAVRTQWHARIGIRNPRMPQWIDHYNVEFASEDWPRAVALVSSRTVAPVWRPWTTPVAVAPPSPPPSPGPPLLPPELAPVGRADVRSTSRVMRAGEGKRSVWLWTEGGRIHASLVPVADATKHRLNSAEVAGLLLADSSKAMPAIRALTGIAEDWRAVADMRKWRRPGRVVVNLGAADIAPRQGPLQRPAGMGPDGSVRTVSGGLPGLGKRHR